MADLHIYAESGAIGDTALNLCREHNALVKWGFDKAIIHTTPILKAGHMDIPSNPIVNEIWRRTNFIKEVVMDVDPDDSETYTFSRKYNAQIHHPMEFTEYSDIKDWVDLRDLTPEVHADKKIALFQPISLRMKPKDHLDDYIPIWTRCLKTLIRKNYHIVMVGAADDPIDLCVEKQFLSSIDNKCGKWSILEAVAFTMYRADIVISCDSWAGIWGAASRKPTAIAWGYRMEHDIDFWVMSFMGNQDCYKYGWSSQKEYCDALLAAYLGTL